MIALQDTLISDDVLKAYFVCDLNRCKGACCVHGDAGAPLQEEEINILENIYLDIKPYMSKEGIEVVEQRGNFEIDIDGDFVTPLVKDKECAYVVFDKQGIAKCAIEQAFLDKKINFQKPLSCHLYPIRIKKFENFTAVNLHEWDICQSAYTCGKKQQTKVYQFLKTPLIRAFGKEWFDALERIEQERP